MRALFVPFAPSLAHVSRCLAVAEAWRSRGHTAFFAIGEERMEMVRKAGFETRPVPEVPGRIFRTDQGWRWLTNAYFDQNINAEQSILAEMKPDAVVFDFRFTTALSAQLAGLPSVSILHGNAIRLARQPSETARLLIGDSKGTRGVTALQIAILRRLFPVGFSLMMGKVARRFSPLLKAHSLPPVSSPFQMLLGDEILVADLADFLPADLPKQAHIVGPLMWAGWEQPAPWLNEIQIGSIIYVTMGSTIESQFLLVKIVDALRETPYNVIISTGSLSLPTDLQIPAHIRVFSIVPGAAVVRHSRLVFHHGGHETLMQALAAGVPSLMLPMNPDQILVAQQAQALGMGRSLRRPGEMPFSNTMLRTITPAQIRHEIDRLITDQECLSVCLTYKQKIEACNGAGSAAQVLEEVASTKKSAYGTSMAASVRRVGDQHIE